MISCTTAADALRQSGQPTQCEEARALLVAADALQREYEPEFELLYSVRGFQYCDSILTPSERAAWADVPERDSRPRQAEVADALADAECRAAKTLSLATTFGSLLEVALDHLTLARVALYRAALAPQLPATAANPHLTLALDGLRQAGQSDELPQALLTAAHWHALTGDAATARRHLDEAQQIAERGPMPLFLADVHLHRARLFRDKSELALAQALIDRHGYGRRREELDDALAASRAW